MIIEHYPALKPKKKWTYEPPAKTGAGLPATIDTKKIVDAIITEPNEFYVKQAAKQKCTVEEWLRRDNIVRDMYKKCTYKPGDKMWPNTLAKCAQYGEVVVDNICYTYAQMEEDSWPKNGEDNPLIVLAHTQDERNYCFFCTVNFLQPHKPKE